ncbi:MAG: sigma-70 family RNA polymerase sigma factor [Deltaproteobacteria bacterium]|nr:sigma-70 family RNA polymerase sigma factor [Deltaproteobacteria bacterium]
MTTRKPFDEDSILAERASRGDRAAFAVLVEKYQGPIHGYALHFFRNSESAADVAQDTFLRAFRFLHTYDASRRFATWLYTIARNLCIDRHRDDRRREQLGAEAGGAAIGAGTNFSEGPLAILEGREDRARLAAAIRELPEKYRTPLVLCYAQGLPYQEISEILGISLNNTKIRIFRAKKLLLRELGLVEDAP